MPNFDYDVRDISSASGTTASLVTLNGSVDPGTFDDFSSMFDTLLENDQVNVIIDFQKLKYINSTGMGLMVQVHDGFTSRGGRMVLLRIPSKVMLVMEMLGLQEFFEIVSNESAALAIFEGGEAESASVEVKLKEDLEAEKAQPKKSAPMIKTAPKKPAVKTSSVKEGQTVCGHCGARLTVAGEGKYACPRCRSILGVDASGEVHTHPARSEMEAEVTLPADLAYVEGLRPLVVATAGKVGLNGDAAAAVSGALEGCARVLVEKALSADAAERLYVYVGGRQGMLQARIYAAGQQLDLEGKELSHVQGLSGAAGQVDRLAFRGVGGGNLFTIEKSAG